jgi:hypothetical protein
MRSKGKSAVCGFALDQFFVPARDDMRDCRNCERMRESDSNPGERIAAAAAGPQPEADALDPLAVACPYCHAKPHAKCTSIRGPCGPHTDRVRAAKKARRQTQNAPRIAAGVNAAKVSALSVVCPKCGAKPDKPCTWKGTNAPQMPHAEREGAALRAARQAAREHAIAGGASADELPGHVIVELDDEIDRLTEYLTGRAVQQERILDDIAGDDAEERGRWIDVLWNMSDRGLLVSQVWQGARCYRLVNQQPKGPPLLRESNQHAPERAKPGKAPPTLAETFAPGPAAGELASYEAVFDIFAGRLADGEAQSVDGLTRQAERVTGCEVTSATVREVVAALVEAGLCTRRGLILTPPGAPSPAPLPRRTMPIPRGYVHPFVRASEPEPSPAADSDTAEEVPGKIREREAWMLRFVEASRPWFEEVSAPLPAKIRVTMSLTRGKRVVAQCYARSASADGTNEILVRLDQAEAIEVADHLLHELCHAADDCQHRHGPGFARIAKAIGLVGPMKSTKLGDNARERSEAIIAELGPFPHAPLDVATGRRSGPARQKNRHVKVTCVHEDEREACGYTCRLSRAWIDRAGPPICPIHEEPMVLEEGPGGGAEEDEPTE